MAKAVGGVDELGRPAIRVNAPGRDGFLAVVDTGFNRSPLMMAVEAQAMGFEIVGEAEIVELGTAPQVRLQQAVGTTRWLGREIRENA